MTQVLQSPIHERRGIARIILAMIVVAFAIAMLFSTGPLHGLVFAQASPTGPVVEIINPNSNSDEISAKQDEDARYHLVAWVANAEADWNVEFAWLSTEDGAQPQLIGEANEVGSSGVFDLKWNPANIPPDGDYILRATLLDGSTVKDTDERDIAVNDDEDAGGPIPPQPTEDQGETVEIVTPDINGILAFNSSGVATFTVDVSEGTETVEGFYSVSPKGTEPVFESCGDAETQQGAADGMQCTLAATDNGNQVTVIAAVVSNADASDPLDLNGAALDSGDAHQVVGTQPGTTTSSTGTDTGTGTGTGTGTQTSTSTSTSTSTRTSTSTSTSSASPSQSSPSPTATETPGPETRRGSTQASIGYSNGAFRGRLRSSLRRCARRGRRVILREVTPGKDKIRGRDRSTNRAGKYVIREPQADGRYYVVAPRKVFVAPDGDRSNCGRDRSRTLRRGPRGRRGPR